MIQRCSALVFFLCIGLPSFANELDAPQSFCDGMLGKRPVCLAKYACPLIESDDISTLLNVACACRINGVNAEQDEAALQLLKKHPEFNCCFGYAAAQMCVNGRFVPARQN